MAVQMQLSTVNLMATATVPSAGVYAGHPCQAGWPASNIRYPHQPRVPAKTVNTYVSGGAEIYRDLTIDFGSAVSFQMAMLIDTNAPLVMVIASNSASYTPNVYASDWLPIQRNIWTRQYTIVHLPPSVITARYLLFRLANPTVDGLSYYRVGGAWVGPLTALPRDIRWDERPRIVEPHRDVPLIGGGTYRVMTGRPYVEMRGQRLAAVTTATPATGDELAGWLNIDDLLGNGRPCAWYFNRGNTGHGFIFRKMNDSDWNINQCWSEDELILHEAVGP